MTGPTLTEAEQDALFVGWDRTKAETECVVRAMTARFEAIVAARVAEAGAKVINDLIRVAKSSGTVRGPFGLPFHAVSLDHLETRAAALRPEGGA